jgi:hypothetical protein
MRYKLGDGMADSEIGHVQYKKQTSHGKALSYGFEIAILSGASAKLCPDSTGFNGSQ